MLKGLLVFEECFIVSKKAGCCIEMGELEQCKLTNTETRLEVGLFL